MSDAQGKMCTKIQELGWVRREHIRPDNMRHMGQGIETNISIGNDSSVILMDSTDVLIIP